MSVDVPTPRPPQAGRRRTVARLGAVQALYQIELTSAAQAAVIAEFRAHRLGREVDGEHYGEADHALFADIVAGAMGRREELDSKISEALTPDWPLDRLDVVLRAVLRAAAYELLGRVDVPARVVISEYLDVANAFFSGKEPALVNGVLDRMARTSRGEELSIGSG